MEWVVARSGCTEWGRGLQCWKPEWWQMGVAARGRERRRAGPGMEAARGEMERVRRQRGLMVERGWRRGMARMNARREGSDDAPSSSSVITVAIAMTVDTLGSSRCDMCDCDVLVSRQPMCLPYIHGSRGCLKRNAHSTMMRPKLQPPTSQLCEDVRWLVF